MAHAFQPHRRTAPPGFQIFRSWRIGVPAAGRTVLVWRSYHRPPIWDLLPVRQTTAPCAICLTGYEEEPEDPEEHIEPRPCKRLQCLHEFCTTCIDEWFLQCTRQRQPPCCPSCKIPVR